MGRNVEDPTLTAAALRKRLDALEGAAAACDDHHVSLLPVVDCEQYQRATWLEKRLKDAVEAAFPADLHIFINPFKPNIWLDGDQATVEHNDTLYTMHVDALVSYWLEDGHKLPVEV